MPRGRAEWAGFLGLAAGGTFVCAALCNLVLDLSTTPARPFGHLGQSLLSTVVLWLAILLLVGVTNRLWLSWGLSLGLSIVVAASSLAKHRVRDEPLFPADLYFLWQPGFLRDMAAGWAVVVVLLLVAGLISATVLVGRRLDQRFPRVRREDDPRTWTRLLLLRVVVVLAASVVLVQAPQFNDEGNPLRAGYETMGAEFLDWRQADNYSVNGFVAGFLDNTYADAMEEPPGYDQAAMAAIAARYERRAAQYNEGRSAGTLADTNVVLLLSEAFSDPEHLEGVDLSEDPLPFVRELMADQPSGQAVGNAIGGGTANMEFEALTGMSQTLFAPQLTTPFQMLVPAHDWMPSVAWYLKALGHDSVAVHPYLATMYRRSAAYPRLGIDEYLDVTDLTGLERIDDNPSPSDASTFDAAVRLLEQDGRPLFMNLVTMQNHFPYGGLYDDPIDNSLGSEALGQYARGVAHSDAATRTLFDDLRRSDEETVVVFFGDHLPGGVYDDALMQANAEKRTQMPFFVWSSHRDLPATRFGATSPIYFMPLALDAVGARIPPYYALLLDLHAEVPTLSTVLPVDASTLSARARRLLHDLRLVQYDFSIGERHVSEEMFHQAPSNR